MDKQYAFLKDSTVLNIVVLDSENESLLLSTQESLGADQVIDLSGVLTAGNAEIGGTYDGEMFWIKQPYASWIKHPTSLTWVAPIPYPQDYALTVYDLEFNKVFYSWDEEMQDWALLPPAPEGYGYLWNDRTFVFDLVEEAYLPVQPEVNSFDTETTTEPPSEIPAPKN